MAAPGEETEEEQGPGKPLLVTSEAFDALEPEWAQLHGQIAGATPFTHPAWHATWRRHFARGVAPVFLSFRRDEELVGVAALEISGDTARTLGDQHVRDYAGPLALAGTEAGVASALFEWLREDLTPRAELWGLVEDSAMAAALQEAAAGQGWACAAEAEAVCPIADISAGFEAYLRALSKKDRHELRRKLRNLAGPGEVRYERRPAHEDPQAIETLLRLMRASRADKDEFLTPAMEAFFRDLAATFGELGLAQIGVMQVDGVEAAALFLFEDGETAYLYNSGYDPAFASRAAGLASKALALRDAAARGLRRFDFLRGDEEYKRRLGGQPRQLVTLRLAAR